MRRASKKKTFANLASIDVCGCVWCAHIEFSASHNTQLRSLAEKATPLCRVHYMLDADNVGDGLPQLLWMYVYMCCVCVCGWVEGVRAHKYASRIGNQVGGALFHAPFALRRVFATRTPRQMIDFVARCVLQMCAASRVLCVHSMLGFELFF